MVRKLKPQREYSLQLLHEQEKQILLHPFFSFSKSDSRSLNMNSNIQDNDTINITNSKNQSHSENRSFGVTSHGCTLSKTGRTLTLNGNINIGKSKNNNTQQDSSIINKKIHYGILSTPLKASQIHTRVLSPIPNH